MLAEPGASLSDLLLGLVVLALALRMGRMPAVHRHWRSSLWWAGAAALAGFVHHGFVVRSERWAGPSWGLISGVIVVAVSYLLAGTVAELLGSRHRTAFWLLRSAGIVAYVILAIMGHAGVSAMLACESLTMISILALWGWAATRRHPMAVPMIIGMAVSGGAGALRALDPDITRRVWIDPVTAYHLGQIVGMFLLYQAITGSRRPDAERDLPGPGGELPIRPAPPSP